MKERHEVEFKVNKPNEWNQFLSETDIQGELVHKCEIKDCGGHLESMTEIEPGIFKMSIIVDKDHPKMKELFNISYERGFRIELKGVPIITQIEANETVEKALEEMEEVLG